MKKTKIALFVIILISLFSCNLVSVEELSDVVVSLQIDNPIMTVNGVKTEIDEGRGTKPVVTEGRTLVPIRAIIEAFDGNVGWNDNTKTVTLTIQDDVINLVIDSNVAYFNDKAYTLDVAPTVINDRTMLPIRFVAESFNLGIAWDGDTNTVSVIRDSFSDDEYKSLISVLPAYSGEAYVQINNNVPFFEQYEIISAII